MTNEGKVEVKALEGSRQTPRNLTSKQPTMAGKKSLFTGPKPEWDQWWDLLLMTGRVKDLNVTTIRKKGNCREEQGLEFLIALIVLKI